MNLVADNRIIVRPDHLMRNSRVHKTLSDSAGHLVKFNGFNVLFVFMDTACYMYQIIYFPCLL